MATSAAHQASTFESDEGDVLFIPVRTAPCSNTGLCYDAVYSSAVADNEAGYDVVDRAADTGTCTDVRRSEVEMSSVEPSSDGPADVARVRHTLLLCAVDLSELLQVSEVLSALHIASGPRSRAFRVPRATLLERLMSNGVPTTPEAQDSPLRVQAINECLGAHAWRTLLSAAGASSVSDQSEMPAHDLLLAAVLAEALGASSVCTKLLALVAERCPELVLPSLVQSADSEEAAPITPNADVLLSLLPAAQHVTLACRVAASPKAKHTLSVHAAALGIEEDLSSLCAPGPESTPMPRFAAISPFREKELCTPERHIPKQPAVQSPQKVATRKCSVVASERTSQLDTLDLAAYLPKGGERAVDGTGATESPRGGVLQSMMQEGPSTVAARPQHDMPSSGELVAERSSRNGAGVTTEESNLSSAPSGLQLDKDSPTWSSSAAEWLAEWLVKHPSSRAQSSLGNQRLEQRRHQLIQRRSAGISESSTSPGQLAVPNLSSSRPTSLGRYSLRLKPATPPSSARQEFEVSASRPSVTAAAGRPHARPSGLSSKGEDPLTSSGILEPTTGGGYLQQFLQMLESSESHTTKGDASQIPLTLKTSTQTTTHSRRRRPSEKENLDPSESADGDRDSLLHCTASLEHRSADATQTATAAQARRRAASRAAEHRRRQEQATSEVTEARWRDRFGKRDERLQRFLEQQHTRDRS